MPGLDDVKTTPDDEDAAVYDSARHDGTARSGREPRYGNEIEGAIATRYDHLSRSQRAVIDRLLADARYAAVISAPELADEVGVSQSTVTRAAQTLGFTGYLDLQARLRRRFFGEAPERIQASAIELGDTIESSAYNVMLEDAENVRATAENLHTPTLEAVINTLVNARRVFIFGARGSYGLSVILGIGLRLLLPDARVLNQAAGDLEDHLATLEPEDAVVVISFRRVDRVTTNVLRYSHDTGAPTVAITDHLSSPAARLADMTLVAWTGPLRLVPSYTAGTSLVNALITATSLQTLETNMSRLQTIERIWKDFDIHVED